MEGNSRSVLEYFLFMPLYNSTAEGNIKLTFGTLRYILLEVLLCVCEFELDSFTRVKELITSPNSLFHCLFFTFSCLFSDSLYL